MPDWEKLVGERLAQLALDEGERREVVAELAGHLQEIYEELREKGASREEAISVALLQVENWEKLQREIYIARTKESVMNARTSRLWVPSFTTLAASVITLVGVGFLGLQPGPLGSRPHHEEWSSHIIGGITGGSHIVNEYSVWLMLLPFLGALGAHLSRRAGGTMREVVLSGVFPAVAWLTIVLVVLSFAAWLGGGIAAVMTPVITPVGPSGLVAVLVLIPGACLLIGVLIYYGMAKRWTRSAF
jgi:hypothetical protein